MSRQTSSAGQTPTVSRRATERFLAALEARAQEVIVEVAREVGAQIEGYHRLMPQIQDNVSEVILETYLHFLQWLRRREPPSPHEAEQLAQRAMPGIALGLSLEDILHSYRIAADIVGETLRRVGATIQGLEPAFVLDCAWLSLRSINALSTALTGLYLEEVRRSAERRERSEAALVEALFDSPPHFELAVRLGQSLGLSLLRDWRVVLAVSAGDEGSPAGACRVLAAARSIAASSSPPGMATARGTRVVLLLPGRYDLRALESMKDAIAGVGGVYEGVTGLRRSHDEALDALNIGLRRRQRLVHAEEVWLERFLMGSVSANQLSAALLAPLESLPPPRRRMLLETAEVYLDEGMNVGKAARALALHPETVRYRVAQLRRYLGKILDNPDGRLALQIALKTRHVLGTGRGGSGT